MQAYFYQAAFIAVLRVCPRASELEISRLPHTVADSFLVPLINVVKYEDYSENVTRTATLWKQTKGE